MHMLINNNLYYSGLRGTSVPLNMLFTWQVSRHYPLHLVCTTFLSSLVYFVCTTYLMSSIVQLGANSLKDCGKEDSIIYKTLARVECSAYCAASKKWQGAHVRGAISTLTI